MLAWAVFVFPIAAGAMLGAWVWARRAGDEAFLLRVRAGLVGGLLGTIGYDIVRIPFDIAGSNTLSPIHVYGVWVTGSESSVLWTDLVGFAYHLSNGITFAWMFSFVMLRRHWAWAIVWGLMLESLAVFSSFGEVFAIRRASYPLLLAYFGHVWYGVPLGLYCQHPERLKTWPLFSKPAWIVGVVGNACVCLWFVLFQYAGMAYVESRNVRVGPNSIRPTWRDMAAGAPLKLHNVTGSPIDVLIRTPTAAGHEIVRHTILPVGPLVVTPEYPGIYQIQAVDQSWRSVFVAVHRDGQYRVP